MNLLQAIILGIVQGITEWLPISSSGHLVIMQYLFGLEPPVIFDIILHLGSLIVILLVFYKEILKLLSDLLQKKKEAWQFGFKVIIASIPIAIVGIIFNDLIKSIFNSLYTVAFSLFFTALLLFLSDLQKKNEKKITFKNAFIVGLAQALAILPGVSRSGSTISTGLMLGIKRKDIAFFSFIIFIPAIVGAAIFELDNISLVPSISTLLFGILAAIISGYVSLKLLLKIIEKGKLSYFGWYCIILGFVLLILPIL